MDEYGITWYDDPKSGMRIQEISNPPVICWGACSGAIMAVKIHQFE